MAAWLDRKQANGQLLHGSSKGFALFAKQQQQQQHWAPTCTFNGKVHAGNCAKWLPCRLEPNGIASIQFGSLATLLSLTGHFEGP